MKSCSFTRYRILITRSRARVPAERSTVRYVGQVIASDADEAIATAVVAFPVEGGIKQSQRWRDVWRCW
jgi:hypothetical protein